MKVPAIVLVAAACLLPLQAHAAPVAPPPTAGGIHLEAEGGFAADFLRCGQIGTENQPVVMMSGGSLFTTIIPGRLRTGDVVCERRLTLDKGLWIWRHDVETGQQAGRRDTVLTVAGTSGSEIIAWTLTKAWPRKLVFDTSSGMEVVVFVADSLVRRGEAVAPVIVWNPASLTYGTPLGFAQLNATTTAAGSFTYTPPAGTILGAGVHTLSATFTAADPEAFLNATVTAQVTVLKAGLTVRADDRSKQYGAPLPDLTFSITGFVNGENVAAISGAPSITTAATVASPVGDYAIVPALGTLAADNYSFGFANGKLSVTPAPLSVKANDASRFYGSPNPPLDGILIGLLLGDPITASFTTSATDTSPAGTYPITPQLSDPNGRLSNYTVTKTDGVLTVRKAILTITANNQEMLFGDPVPPLTFRYSGFVLGEGPSVLSGAPALTTTATSSSLPGSYPIVITAGTLSAANYSFQFFNGTLTVLGPRTMLRRAATLSSTLIAPNLHPADREKLEQIVSRLTAASDRAIWIDESHPLKSTGNAVFADAKDAVVKLTDLLGGNKSSLDSGKLRAALDLVVRACRLVAQIAINDAVAANANPKNIEKARTDLRNGDADAAAKRYSNAVLNYRNAWADLN